MTTNFKVSSKMHLFIIISSVVVALGLLMGLVFQFAMNGYFNYGADWSNYKSINVSYSCVDYAEEDDVKEICLKAFESAGVKYYSVVSGSKTGDIVGGEITYKFMASVDDGKLAKAVESVNAAFSANAEEGGISQSTASWHKSEGLLGGYKALWRGAVAVAAAIVFHFAYFAIRYKLTMALAAALADVHNLALYVSLLSLTRIPVGSSMIAFAVLTVLLTAIGTSFLFDRMRKNIKNEDFKKLSNEEFVDKSAGECFKINLFLPVCVAVLAVVMFALMSISAMSVIAVLSPVLCGLVCCIACAYGTLMFVPSVYSRFKKLGDEYKKNHTRAPRVKTIK